MSHRVALTTLVLVSLAAVATAAQPDADTGEFTGEFTAHGFGVVRVENEYKLSVPREQTEDVWAYLQKRYAADGAWLAELGPGLSDKLSDEQFEDRYFDDPDLHLLAAESGIRHRTRLNLENAHDRKSGRELVQVKLQRPGEQTSRSEIKFSVEHYAPEKPLDTHPLIGLIDRDQRSEFVNTVAESGFDALALEPKLTVDQRRRRVYIAKDDNPFATITLDEVSSEKWGEAIAFTEIEIELNEIAYTEASADVRRAMEATNERMKNDLVAAFPRIVQDQTPKYNKVFRAFDGRFLLFAQALRIGMPIGRVAAFGAGALAIFTALAIATRPRRRRIPRAA